MLSRTFKILAVGLFLLLILVPTYVSFVSSSSGYIRINSKSSSIPGQIVPSGGNVSLYFGGVTWSGSIVYLYLSHNASALIVPGDLRYAPDIPVSNITSSSPSDFHYYGSGGWIGNWVVGENWINGSLTSNLPAGNYYIKAYDGVSTVAVTDTYITVLGALLQISPSAGAGGVSVKFTGSGVPASAPVTVSYFDPTFNSWNYWYNVTANSTGYFTFSSEMPDLRKSMGAGIFSDLTYTPISFRAEAAGVV